MSQSEKWKFSPILNFTVTVSLLEKLAADLIPKNIDNHETCSKVSSFRYHDILVFESLLTGQKSLCQSDTAPSVKDLLVSY